MKKYKYTKTFSFEGRRYFVRGDTLSEVYEKKAQRLFELQNGMVTYDGSLPFETWAKTAIETYKAGVKPDTKSAMLYRLNRCVFPEIGSYPISKIKPLQLQKILNKQAGMSKSHLTKLRSDLRFVFQKAVENKMILESPAATLVLPESYENKRRSLTDYERAHLLRVCETDDRFVLFLLMLYCGCRPCEAMTAQGMDIQTLDGYNVLHIRGTKTANSDRFVPIPDILFERIKNTPKFANIALTSAGKPLTKTDYVRLTNRLRRELNLSMGCKTYRNQLIPPFPLDPSFVPYFLRHTYCTDLASKGVDIRTAQKLMGHSDIKVTANIYTHVLTEHIVTAAELLGATPGATPNRNVL